MSNGRDAAGQLRKYRRHYYAAKCRRLEHSHYYASATRICRVIAQRHLRRCRRRFSIALTICYIFKLHDLVARFLRHADLMTAG